MIDRCIKRLKESKINRLVNFSLQYFIDKIGLYRKYVRKKELASTSILFWYSDIPFMYKIDQIVWNIDVHRLHKYKN